MNEAEARAILSDYPLQPDGACHKTSEGYASWDDGQSEALHGFAILDGEFTSDQLEAIAVMLRIYVANNPRPHQTDR